MSTVSPSPETLPAPSSLTPSELATLAKLQMVLGHLNEALSLMRGWTEESVLPSWFDDLVNEHVPTPSTRAQIRMMAPLIIEAEIAPALQRETEKTEELRSDLESAIGALEKVLRCAL